MASSNIYGQLSLMYRRVDALQEVFTVLSLTYKDRAAKMAAEKEKLAHKVKKIREVMARLGKKHTTDRTTLAEVKSMQKEIAAAQQILVVRKFVSMDARFDNRPSRQDGNTGRFASPGLEGSLRFGRSVTYLPLIISHLNLRPGVKTADPPLKAEDASVPKVDEKGEEANVPKPEENMSNSEPVPFFIIDSMDEALNAPLDMPGDSDVDDEDGLNFE